jgi:hypothetical protein
MHATRVGDKTMHAGVITGHASDVEVGGPTVTFRTIKQPGTSSTSTTSKQNQSKPDPKLTEPEKEAPKAKESTETKTDGGVHARFALVDPAEPTLTDTLQFACSSWDPDLGGSSSTPNPTSIPWRRWTLRLDGVLAAVETTTDSNPTWSVSLVDWQRNSVRSGVLNAHALLTVRDAQKHEATAELRFQLKTGGVKARLSLVSPEPLVAGDEATFECRSWDPDTGGTEESPNPTSIEKRVWTVSTHSSSESTVGKGTEASLKMPALPDGEDEMRVIVSLRVVDTQGDEDESGTDFYIHRSAIRTFAEIHLDSRGSAGMVAWTGKDGAITVPSGAEVRLRGTARADRPDGTRVAWERPYFEWQVRSANGEPATLRWDSGPTESHASFVAFGKVPYNIKLITNDQTVHDSASGSSSHYPRATATLVCSPGSLSVRIVHVSSTASDRSRFQHRVDPNIVVEGDSITITAEATSDVAIRAFRWYIWMGDRYTTFETDDPILDVPYINLGGLLTAKGTIKIGIQAISKDGVASPEPNNDDGSLFIQSVCPVLTLASAILSVLRALGEKALAIIPDLLLAYFTTGVSWTIVCAELAKEIAEDGIRDLLKANNLPEWMAPVVVLALDTSTKSFVLNWSKTRNVVRENLMKEITRRVGGPLESNPEKWLQMAEVVFPNHVQAWGPPTLREFGADALLDFSKEATKILSERNKP